LIVKLNLLQSTLMPYIHTTYTIIIELCRSMHSSAISVRQCYLWPWHGPPLTAIQYVMYFRIFGWRHVCIQWSEWAESETTLMFCRVRQMAAPWSEICCVSTAFGGI